MKKKDESNEITVPSKVKEIEKRFALDVFVFFFELLLV